MFEISAIPLIRSICSKYSTSLDCFARSNSGTVETFRDEPVRTSHHRGRNPPDESSVFIFRKNQPSELVAVMLVRGATGKTISGVSLPGLPVFRYLRLFGGSVSS